MNTTSSAHMSLAERQLGLPQHCSAAMVPRSYVHGLQKHLEIYPHDTKFTIMSQPKVGFGKLTCLENGCEQININLERNPVRADGGLRIGIGGLEAYQEHICQHPTHVFNRNARIKQERESSFLQTNSLNLVAPLLPPAVQNGALSSNKRSAPGPATILLPSKKRKTHIDVAQDEKENFPVSPPNQALLLKDTQATVDKLRQTIIEKQAKLDKMNNKEKKNQNTLTRINQYSADIKVLFLLLGELEKSLPSLTSSDSPNSPHLNQVTVTAALPPNPTRTEADFAPALTLLVEEEETEQDELTGGYSVPSSPKGISAIQERWTHELSSVSEQGVMGASESSSNIEDKGRMSVDMDDTILAYTGGPVEDQPPIPAAAPKPNSTWKNQLMKSLQNDVDEKQAEMRLLMNLEPKTKEIISKMNRNKNYIAHLVGLEPGLITLPPSQIPLSEAAWPAASSIVEEGEPVSTGCQKGSVETNAGSDLKRQREVDEIATPRRKKLRPLTQDSHSDDPLPTLSPVVLVPLTRISGSSVPVNSAASSHLPSKPTSRPLAASVKETKSKPSKKPPTQAQIDAALVSNHRIPEVVRQHFVSIAQQPKNCWFVLLSPSSLVYQAWTPLGLDRLCDLFRVHVPGSAGVRKKPRVERLLSEAPKIHSDMVHDKVVGLLYDTKALPEKKRSVLATLCRVASKPGMVPRLQNLMGGGPLITLALLCAQDLNVFSDILRFFAMIFSKEERLRLSGMIFPNKLYRRNAKQLRAACSLRFDDLLPIFEKFFRDGKLGPFTLEQPC